MASVPLLDDARSSTRCSHPIAPQQWRPSNDATGDEMNADSDARFKPDPAGSATPLGKPSRKKRLYTKDILAAALSWICLGLAIAAVASNDASWYLGVGSNQLIVLGFLLSIMNLCLGSVTPTLYLLLEARIGPSTLQNYQGLLRNQIFSSRLSLAWRIVLGVMLALPLGLSAAYKSFVGGQSAKIVHATDYMANASYYGMFTPPGLQPLGRNIGLTLFFNATLPFSVASSALSGPELPLPPYPQPYGFNLLLLSNESTAMLDIPRPDYIFAVQDRLALGESWSVSAPVLGTVATLNNSRSEDPDGFDSDFVDLCVAAKASNGAFTELDALVSADITGGLVLVDHVSTSNQSVQYIGFAPANSLTYASKGGWDCKGVSQYLQLYNINRQSCHGTWSITRGGIDLISGSCDSHEALPLQKQQIVFNNNLFLGYWYMPPLLDFLGEFQLKRNQSDWKNIYMATGVAAMLWSRITALNGASSVIQTYRDGSPSYPDSISDWEDLGIMYPVNDTVTYLRPTLKKSGLLYCVLMIQPILLVLILALTALLYSTPLSKGFGLISILSGITRESLDDLAGASLSGELTKSVKLALHPTGAKGSHQEIEYRITQSPTVPAYGGGLVKGALYY